MLAVVLSFDQFPLRLLGCYGNPIVETPCFNRIAAAGQVFDQHFGEDFSPQPAGHAWWSGCYHFPRAGSPGPERMPSLPSLLKQAGVESRWLRDKDPSPKVPLPAEAQFTVVDSFAELVHQGGEVLREWADAEESPRLLWLKAGGSAWPIPNESDTTDRSAEDWADVREQATSAVEGIDRLLEPLWEQVRRLAETQQVLFVFTSARGLPLGERAGASSSGAEWGEESVHLPLLAFLSGSEGGERRRVFTQSLDLAATLLEFLAPNAQTERENFSFLPIFREENLPARREYVTYGCHGTWDAIRTAEFHLVRLQEPENSVSTNTRLFIKPDDIWDWHDVSSQEPGMTEALSQQLDAFLDAAQNQCPLPPNTLTITLET